MTEHEWELGTHDELEGRQEIGFRNSDGTFCPVLYVVCYEKDDVCYERDQATAESVVRAHNSHEDLLAACKAQHEAIDRLFAMLITEKGMNAPFFPSKCGQPWDALCQGNAAIEKAKP